MKNILYFFLLSFGAILVFSCTKDEVKFAESSQQVQIRAPGNGNTVPVCHQLGNGITQTIYVNQNSVQSHLDHGDSLGVCSDCDPACPLCEYSDLFDFNNISYYCDKTYNNHENDYGWNSSLEVNGACFFGILYTTSYYFYGNVYHCNIIYYDNSCTGDSGYIDQCFDSSAIPDLCRETLAGIAAANGVTSACGPQISNANFYDDLKISASEMEKMKENPKEMIMILVKKRKEHLKQMNSNN